jgi:hypothetical protein
MVEKNEGNCSGECRACGAEEISRDFSALGGARRPGMVQVRQIDCASQAALASKDRPGPATDPSNRPALCLVGDQRLPDTHHCAEVRRRPMPK